MKEPFATFEQLARSGRVGVPVFLRCAVTGPPSEAEETLSAILEAATAILDDRPATLFARGTPNAGDFHTVVTFVSGKSALAVVAPGPPSWDVMLLGNHGAAYTAYVVPALRQEPARHPEVGGVPRSSAPPVTRPLAWAQLTRRSLAEGRAVAVEEVGDG